MSRPSLFELENHSDFIQRHIGPSVSEQQKMAPGGLGGLDLQSLGLPSEQEYIASYCQYRGIDRIDNWNFFLAFSLFRLAAIVQGVAKRAAMGNASNEKAAAAGGLVRPLAELGLEALQDN